MINYRVKLLFCAEGPNGNFPDVLRCVVLRACPVMAAFISDATLHASKVQEGRKRKLTDVSAVTFANWQSVSGEFTPMTSNKYYGPPPPLTTKYSLFVGKFAVFFPFPFSLYVMYERSLSWELGSYLTV